MAEFNVRSDSVDVEQIMQQIRARIREKRGADYTEQELQQLANVKLEKFLDPRGVRSDLVDQFRRHRVVSPEPPKYEFEDTTLYETHRGPLRFIRKLLHPILKLFINPNPLIHALHVQKQVNDEFHKRFRQREEMDPLYYQVVHNLVVEITRLGIEVHNLKMQVESLSSRMDFDERRARSLESVVQYRPPQRSQPPPQQPAGQRGARGPESRTPPPAPAAAPPASGATNAGAPAGTENNGIVASASAQTANGPGISAAPGQRADGGERRRRRRRRRRRPGQNLADSPNAQSGAGGTAGTTGTAAPSGFDNGPDTDGDDTDGGAADQ